MAVVRLVGGWAVVVVVVVSEALTVAVLVDLVVGATAVGVARVDWVEGEVMMEEEGTK